MLRPPQINAATGWLIKQSRRSWWQVRYGSGKVVSEWETATEGVMFSSRVARTSRWEEVSKIGIRGLYLLCPSGQAHALEANGDYQFFQLKVGTFSLGSPPLQTCLAHIIGKIDDDNGRCVCYAWEYDNQRSFRFEDNVTNMVYHNIGPLSLGEHTGVR